MFLKRLIISIVLIFPLFLSAQETEPKKKDNNKDSLSFYAAHEDGIFTSFDSIEFRPVGFTQFYRPFGKPRLPLAFSSNIGLAFHSYEVLPQRWSLHWIQGGYLPYIFTKDSMSYYKVSRPITILDYENGERREQYFSVFHTQNLGEGLNIAFEYERITSDGFFVRQLTNHTRFRSTYHLQSRNQRFTSKGHFAISNLESQESGGIFIDSVNQETNNPALLGVNLTNAQSRSRGRILGAHNEYKVLAFGPDSNLSTVGLFHEVNWDRSWRNYEDNIDLSSSFYSDYFIDSTRTADTSKSEVLSNSFGLQLDQRVQIGYSISHYNYFQNFFTDTNFRSQHFFASFQDSILKHLILAKFNKGVSGYHQEDLMLNASISGKLKSLAYGMYLDLENNVVDYFLLKQRTNNHFYRNNFEPTTYLRLGLNLREEKSGVGLLVQLKSLGNFIYFDKNAELVQLSEDIQVFSASLQKEFSFLRNFRLYNRIHFQSIAEPEVLPLPNLFSYHSFYYNNKFFKNSLHFQLGFDLFVISEYNGYAFSPEQGQFYLNPSSQKLGNIQQLDIFMNLGITKNGRIFIKMENLLEPTYSQASERIYQYPNPGRALKFGFSWKMIN